MCSIRTITTRSWGDTELVSNLTVNKDHTYTLPGATTHNCDSLAMACILTKDQGGEGAEPEQVQNPFYS